MHPAQALVEARCRAGLSQRRLAKDAGTSQSAVALYESGAREPSFSTLQRLLAACGQRLELTVNQEPGRKAVSLSEVRRQRSKLITLGRRRGARRLRVFGSLARGEAGPESDVDLLVDLDPGRTLLDLLAFRHEATELLGVEVDVATPQILRRSVAEAALRDAVPV